MAVRSGRVPPAVKAVYSIREASALSGLPASTLRYYESVGVVPPAPRTETGGHRYYTADDVELLTWVGCLAATGMPVAQMKTYVANGSLGAQSAQEQRELLRRQDERLQAEQSYLALRREYVQLKIAYWEAVEVNDQMAVDRLADAAAHVGEKLKNHQSESN